MEEVRGMYLESSGALIVLFHLMNGRSRVVMTGGRERSSVTMIRLMPRAFDSSE
jgi:hypothetical protein